MYIIILKPQNSIKIVDNDEREFFEMKKNVNPIFQTILHMHILYYFSM